MPLGDDLSPFFGEFAVAVTAGAISGKGILDAPGVQMGDGMVNSTEYVLTCKTADFGGLAAYSAITVDGVPYTVREVNPIDDGKLCQISMSKV